MLYTITGYLFIVLGFWWFISPGRMKLRFTKKIHRRIRRLIWFAFFLLGAFLLQAAREVYGAISKLLIFFGLTATIYGSFLLSRKTRQEVFEFLSRVPEGWWRVFAVLQIAVGLLLLRAR
ncbi:MAG: hypothetical protein JW844_00715 [Candidatus Omnitrophica bacterium]|nr:hypothetical protein [Candidatus Omnitrophota bacterium]